MLKIINLYVIDKIFENLEVKVGATSRMLYINCLTHYFRDKSAIVSNATAFELFEEDFKDYTKFKKNMQELHKAGLVTIGIKSIVFNNHWGQHIDRSQLEKVGVNEYVAGFTFKKASEYKDELLKSDQLIELAQMQYKLTKADLIQLIELFIKQQSTFEKTYSNFSDCIKHFSFWLPKNISNTGKEKVKSTGKILGM